METTTRRSITHNDLMVEAIQMDDKDATYQLMSHLWTLYHELGNIEQRITKATNEIQYRLDRITERVASHEHLNELGELQGMGGRLDMDIALRADKWTQIGRIQDMLNLDVTDYRREVK